MADKQIGNAINVTARGGSSQNGGASDQAGLTLATYPNIDSLKARLQAVNATSYTTARLATMSVNDLVYAVRLADNPASI